MPSCLSGLFLIVRFSVWFPCSTDHEDFHLWRFHNFATSYPLRVWVRHWTSLIPRSNLAIFFFKELFRSPPVSHHCWKSVVANGTIDESNFFEHDSRLQIESFVFCVFLSSVCRSALPVFKWFYLFCDKMSCF